MNPGILSDIRRSFHCTICGSILGHRPGTRVFSIADVDNRSSIDLAERMVDKMGCATCANPGTGGTAGTLFGQYTRDFVQASFDKLQHLRPGKWRYAVVSQKEGISGFEQYTHLSELAAVLKAHKQLATALGGDYLITPDVIVARVPATDAEINASETLVHPSELIATHTPLRAANFTDPLEILHASISCKWTMRSDRAQNTRTEALNLIRNRKGKTPHIVAVTFEPLPSRLASIAMGTGDVDCTYHGALYELLEAASESGNRDQEDILQTLVQGRRLRDISDLPFDLAC